MNPQVAYKANSCKKTPSTSWIPVRGGHVGRLVSSSLAFLAFVFGCVGAFIFWVDGTFMNQITPSRSVRCCSFPRWNVDIEVFQMWFDAVFIAFALASNFPASNYNNMSGCKNLAAGSDQNRPLATTGSPIKRIYSNHFYPSRLLLNLKNPTKRFFDLQSLAQTVCSLQSTRQTTINIQANFQHPKGLRTTKIGIYNHSRFDNC